MTKARFYLSTIFSLGRGNLAALVLAAAFGLFFASISLVNHYHFRTNALDLAYYNQALYDFSKFKIGEYTLVTDVFPHIFADHFEPILFVLAPLRYLFGTWTLLLVQIAAILVGGFGVKRS